MPKKKEVTPEVPSRFPRRAASKEALKQMQKITAQADSDSPETLEIPSDDDEVVTIDPSPKKKYKLSHRKSADDRDVIVLKAYEDDSLILDSWTDDLSPAQIAMRNATKKEIDDINDRLEALLKETSSQVIHTGDNSALYELELEVKNAQKSNSVTPAVVQPQTVKNSQGIQLVMDARSGVVVGTMTPATSATLAAVSNVSSVSNVKTPQTRKRTRAAANLPTTSVPPPPLKLAKTSATPTIVSVTSTPNTTQQQQRATEATAVGGLSHGNLQQKQAAIVDLTSDENRSTIPDSREVSFNKLQGKTFPSLVVVARPHLRAKENVTVDRQKLDSKVKAVLMHIPTKFTEWLIQVGLIRSEQTCGHGNKLKLGMYSDVTKFPFSGGYVWISDCCPQKFVSVFSNSVFEGSPHPPTVILKLIYHWACQTNVQNVVQWVKVDNLYVKGMNTWLRAICTVAIQTHLGLLGNPQMTVEVGVISLGTTSQDGNQRQVKVEVLGVLDVATKLIRLKAVEPMVDGDRNYRRRFSKILEPLVKWVHPASIIITDLTVDKSTLLALGFKNVVQSSANDQLSNLTIMDYLRRIVPRMFQNTLSLLSRQIIQQFLDELVWRECYGTTPALAFDNIITHLAEQTKVDGQNLVHRLTKIASNPFKNWSLKNVCQQQMPTTSPPPLVKAPTQPPLAPALPPLTPLVMTTEPTMRPYKNKRTKTASPLPESSSTIKSRKSPDIPEQMVPLEHYYYGTIDAPDGRSVKISKVLYKCGLCKAQFSNNIKLMSHLFHHINWGNVKFLCRYCLIQVNSAELLEKHVQKTHPSDTKVEENFVCVICEGKFYNPYSLGKHMSREHVPSELPYQCLACRMRCSSHKQVIDHFYDKHDGGSALQCPLCLKCMTVYSNGKVLTQNMTYFVQHLQKHCKKIGAKKCPKCALWFIQKDLLKDHTTKMHTSMRRKAGLVPWPVPRAIIMVPKSRQDEPNDQNDVNISNLILSTSLDKYVCRECGCLLSLKDHFPSIQNCCNDNCQYTTCCKRAMIKHVARCKELQTSIPVMPLPFKMYCVCGHNDNDGNSMAKHLTVCERKSAYPSEAEAKAATVTHSMLDVLGLMRRTEEPSSSSVDIKEDNKDDIKIEETMITKSSDKDTEKNEDDKEEVKMLVDLCGDDDISSSESVKKNNGDTTSMDCIEKESDKDDEPDENGLLNESTMDITECVSVEDDVVQKKPEDDDNDDVGVEPMVE